MTFFGAQALRDTLAASYEDPNRGPTDLTQDEMSQMLDDIVRRISNLNAEAQLAALDRTMAGEAEVESITDTARAAGEKLIGMVPGAADSLKSTKRVLRSRIGRGVAKFAIKRAVPAVPGALVDKGVDIAGAYAQRDAKKNKS